MGQSSSTGRDKNFLFSTSSEQALEAHPVSNLIDTDSSSPGVKRPECEADHSPPSSAEVKNTGIYTSIPPYVFMV
jgi:hypothetical protein